MATTNPYVRGWDVASTTSDDVYRVSERKDGSFACNCPAWKFHRAPKPECKHICSVKGQPVFVDRANLRNTKKLGVPAPAAGESAQQIETKIRELEGQLRTMRSGFTVISVDPLAPIRRKFRPDQEYA